MSVKSVLSWAKSPGQIPVPALVLNLAVLISTIRTDVSTGGLIRTAGGSIIVIAVFGIVSGGIVPASVAPFIVAIIPLGIGAAVWASDE